jgi:hypothetical protein
MFFCKFNKICFLFSLLEVNEDSCTSRKAIKRVSRNSFRFSVSLSPTSHFCAPTNYISMIEMWNILLVKLVTNNRRWRMKTSSNGAGRDLVDQINKSHENASNARNQNPKEFYWWWVLPRVVYVSMPPILVDCRYFDFFFIDLLMKHRKAKKKRIPRSLLLLTHSSLSCSPFHVHRKTRKNL